MILIVGNLVDGFTFYGPFATSFEAIDWAEKAGLKEDWRIVCLVKP